MNLNLRLFILVSLQLLVQPKLWATHYRAGEITYKQISLLTYEITAITYTDYTKTSADRPNLDIYFGDGKFENVVRSNGDGEIISTTNFNQVKRNIYRTSHTYPGPGNYIISLTDPNRIDGINNINKGQSVNVAFYVESYLKIAAGFGFNQSPVLLFPPIDIGCRFRVFKHNPSAYDPDGDSLAFTLIAPKSAQGQEVPNYTIPVFNDSFTLGINNGEVNWATPQFNGHYNIAILISEYRKGVLMGYVVRDMQIFISDPCFNTPPVITTLQDTCIEANKLLSFNVTATDINPGQLVTLRAYGGPFSQVNSLANILPNPTTGTSPVTTNFRWIPSCNAIRYAKHQADFRATDNDPTNPLSDFKNVRIKVNGPAPKNISITQDSNGFILKWNRDTCNLAFGYKIYRRIDSSYWQHGYCETGVPAYTGFELLDTTQGLNNNVYFDNNFGKGLSPLIRYCYIITTLYPPRSENGTIIFSEEVESYASIEVCDLIKLTQPAITKVSVLESNNQTGKIEVNWIKPTQIDTVDQFPPPYRYVLQRSILGNNTFIDLKSFSYATYAALNDTGFIDTAINTSDLQYNYKVLLFCTKNGIERFATQSTEASSVRANTINTNRTVKLSWSYDVPWKNSSFIVYKKNNNVFDSIAFTQQKFYNDTGLINGLTYCYKIESIGNYNLTLYKDSILNFSQEICGTPLDTVRPCAPILLIDSPCNTFSSYSVKLNWFYPNTCDKDVVKYRIYWRKNITDKWLQIDSVSFGTNAYSDNRELLKFSIAGCYAVIAVDSFNNASYFNNATCIDNCPFYKIPNVFTPNNDAFNKQLTPFPYRFIDKIDLVIYNRWGQEVFTTNNPDILWDGKDKETGNNCTEGVYYYICDIFESYLEGTKKRTIRGTITLIRD